MTTHSFVPEKMGVDSSKSKCGIYTDEIHRRGDRYASNGEEVTCRPCSSMDRAPAF